MLKLFKWFVSVQVLEWVKTHVGRNPHIYLTPVFKDYENHLADLKSKHNIDKQPTTVSSASATPTLSTTASVGFETTIKPSEASSKLGNGSTVSTAPSFSFGSEKKDFSFGSSDSAKTGFSGVTPAAKTGFTFGTFGGSTSTFG